MSEIDMKPKSFLTEEAKKDIQNLLDIDSGGGGGGTSIEIDDTLTVEGAAADAKATGDAIANIHIPEPSEEQIAEAVNDWLEEHPEAITVQDGSITKAKLNAEVIDDTLSVSGSAADAKTAGDEISGLKNALDAKPEIKDSDATGVDLDVSDPSGNVILRLANGHVLTKNFDSSDIEDIEDALDGKMDNNLGASNEGKILLIDQSGDVIPGDRPENDVITKGTTAVSDMDISDINGNVIARFADGYIKTKNFNSAFIRQLSSQKWACIGDSLTEVNKRTTMHYYDYIAEETGIEVYNLGHSGCGYAKVGGYGKNFIGIAAEVPNDADVITIFGSGNDGSAGLDLGTPTDSGTTTICGCINATFDVLYANHPTVPLGVITPTPWANSEPSDSGTGMKNYCEALVQICALRGIPCLDLYHCSNLHPTDVDFRPLAYSKDDGDGIHPDETGHKIIAPRIRQFLFSLI